jgi:hypothetical protein
MGDDLGVSNEAWFWGEEVEALLTEGPGTRRAPVKASEPRALAPLAKWAAQFLDGVGFGDPLVTARQATERVGLGLIEDHYLGHEGVDASLLRQTASPPDCGEILVYIARIVRLVEILRKELEETFVVWLVAALK